MSTVTFRKAERKDIALILEFIQGLAAYEKMENEVVADEVLLEEWIFDKQKAEVIFAVADGKEVGFALFFHNFSTFLGRAGLYLEDLFVKPAYRGKGYGKALIDFVAAKYKGTYSILQVGTGDSPLTVPFYEKSGFARSHSIENFFIDNYDHPIFEGGVQLTDMIYLQKKI